MKIKIFVDAHVFDGTYQGTTTYIEGLYNALVKDDKFEITMAASDVDNLKLHFKDTRFKFVALPSGSKFRRLAIDIPKIITKNGYDYAHFQYITPLVKTCKYINTIHDILFYDFPEFFPFRYRFVKRRTFKYSALRSDIICTVSNYSKNALVKHFRIKEDKIIVTPNAVSNRVVAKIDVKTKYNLGQYILFVSRFEPRKNHCLLLRAYLDLNLVKSHKLVFIGKRDDVETHAFNILYNTLTDDIKASILFFEDVSMTELNSFYSQAALFIYPSVAEGFGIPPLEAAVAGCKVVCSKQTAMADFTFFKKYAFDPSDVEDLKIKISAIIKDNNYPYLEIANQVATDYNWDVIASDFSMKLK